MLRLPLCLCLLLAVLAAPTQAQTAAPASQAPPFSPVIVSGDTIFLAGHLGRIPGTNQYPDGGIGPQTRQTLDNIGITLASIGATHADLVRCQVFLADIDDFADMNAAYRTFFPINPPARTTVAVAGLAAEAMIEIECTGRIGHGAATALTTGQVDRSAGSQEKLRAKIEAAPGLELIISDVIIPPNAEVARHYHPGEEYLYILEGSAVHVEDGKPDQVLRAGDTYVIPPEARHEPYAGPDGTRAIVVRVHTAGEPERILVDDTDP